MSLLKTAQKKLNRFAEFVSRDNVRFTVRKADGSVRKQFQQNALGMAIVNWARRVCPQPYDGKGHTVDHIKRGILPKLAVWGLVIPLVTGSWVSSFSFKNGVTNAGKAAISSRINGSGAEAVFAQIGIGTGTTAFAAGNTTLETEVDASGAGASGVHALSSAATTVSRTTTTVTNDTARITGTISITGTIAITESGVFNANTNGVLLCRQTFSAVNVISGDSFVPTWDVKNA